MRADKGVVEAVLYCDDVRRAAQWYTTVLGLPVVLEREDRLHVLQVDGGRCLLLFKRGGTLVPFETPAGTIPPHDGAGPAHIAFGMDNDGADRWVKHLEANGVSLEGRVDWGKHDVSLYFRDPENHMVELISEDHWLHLIKPNWQ